MSVATHRTIFMIAAGRRLRRCTLDSGDYIAIHITRGSAILYGAAVDNATNDPSAQLVTR